MDVVEVARARVCHAAGYNRLQLLGQDGLKRVSHELDRSLFEQKRVLIFDGARCDSVACGHVYRQRHRHRRVDGIDVNSDAWIVIGFPDVLGAAELECPVVIGRHSGDLAKYRLGRLVREIESPHRRVEIHGRARGNTEERGYEHAAFDHDIIPPFGSREPLQEPFVEVALHKGLRWDPCLLGLVVDLRLELHRIVRLHKSASR